MKLVLVVKMYLIWIFHWLRYQKYAKFDSKDHIFAGFTEFMGKSLQYILLDNSANSSFKSEVTLNNVVVKLN